MENFKATVEDVVPVLQPGIYPATFSKIELKENDNGTFWLWTFLAHDGTSNVEVTATTSPRVTPRTKAAKFIAGLGAKLDIGGEVDFMEYIDTPCQLVITINEQGYSRIESVLPYVTKNDKAK